MLPLKVGYFIFGSGSATSRLACLLLPLEDDERGLCVSSSLLDAFDPFNSAISSAISILSLRNSSRIAFMNNFGSVLKSSLFVSSPFIFNLKSCPLQHSGLKLNKSIDNISFVEIFLTKILGSNSLRSRMKQFRASFIALVLALVIGPPIPCNGSFRVLVFHP
ncbi:uncharacterized protein G2W53_033220 [Senna tora]|uniref:Uncharacterized protein n=1 Tax=Senna tora TaxID=362788 RepID=A0A834SY15_9FABA|nr:uncharacterized protein G2W53_033220 [Senna tora]